MAKYKNTRLRVQRMDYVAIIFFFVLLALSVFFGVQKAKTEDLYNIEKTEVDYIIPAPSRAQVKEIGEQSFVEAIVPYLYRTNKYNGVSTNLYILETKEDLANTMFANSLLVKTTGKDVSNPLYVSQDFAAAAKLAAGDTLPLEVEGQEIQFQIVSIYKSDHRNVGGSVYAVLQNDLRAAIEEKRGQSYRYSGAFVCCNDAEEFTDYLEKYVPEGDLRGASEFASEELYQIYLKEHNTADYVKETTNFASLSRDIHNRNDAKLLRYSIIMYIAAITGLLALLLRVFWNEFRYIKEDVVKDIRNNFTLEQEQNMFRRYERSYWILALAVSGVAAVANVLLGGTTALAFSIIVIGMVVIAMLVNRMVVANKMNMEFMTKKAVVDEELRRKREKERAEKLERERKAREEETSVQEDASGVQEAPEE